MEPQEPAKNDEGTGFSKRRISSILKAPRKSARFPDPEQQENVVECAKPVEKRNSRRVSFAPANDVLLFSKDVKNASPARSPLQELMTATAAASQNRVQVVVTEDGTQQIMGMATLLNAPLHASQQQDKVCFGTAEDLGEKTVMFSTDDAFMDMTHSHTINIASDAGIADISLQNYDILPTGGEKTVMFTADDASMDMTLSRTLNMTNVSVSLPTGRNMDLSVEKRNMSSSVPSLDPGFENFLASLSKPSGPSSLATAEINSSLAHSKTQKADVDKENQMPTSVSAMMKKSLNTSRKTGESSYGSALCPEVDVSMDMTEAQTGRILGFTDADDPFQCLFPTQDMYAHSDKKVSQTTEVMKTQQQQSSKKLGYSEPKAVATTENRVRKVITEEGSGWISDMTSLKNPSLHVSHPRHKVNFDARDECKEKTIMFTADDEFMDMTQSHTVNIAHGPLAPQKMSADGLDTGSKNFLPSLSKPSDPSVNPFIERMVPPTAASINTNSSLSQLKTSMADVVKDNWSLHTSQTVGESVGGAVCPESDVSMDMTEAQTGRIIGITASDDPFQFLLPTQDMYPDSGSLKKEEMTSGQRSSEALGSSDYTGLESSLRPSLKPKVQRHQDKFDTEDDYREKTVRFSADDACMDVTRSHTVNIATGFKLQSHQNLGFSPFCREKTVRFNANDAAMDMTKCLTVNIDSNLVSDSVCPVKKQESEKYGPPRDGSSSAHNLERGFNTFLTSLSKPSDLSIDPVFARMTPTAASSSNIGDSSNVGTVCPEDDVSMDMTEAQTGKILGITDTNDPLQCLFPTQDVYGNLKKMEMTSQLQSTEVPRSSNCKGMEKSLKTSLKTKMQVKFDAEDDCREKTVRFSADDAAMDVTQSHTVNIATHFKPQSHLNLDFLPACGEKTVRFTADNACMDVTKSHTVNIASEFQLPSHQNLDQLPSCGEKTVRFTASDAAMDVTRSHTVNITSHLGLQSHQNMEFLPISGEKTVRFTANDAAMDVTRSHTVNIATDFELPSHQNVDPLPTSGEKTVRFTANDAAMDVTRSHTVNITSHLGPESHQNLDFLPTCGEKTARFNSNDAAMDMTQCLTVNIDSNSVSDSVLQCQESNILSTRGNTDLPLTVKKREKNRSSSAHSLDPGFKNSLAKMSGPWTNPVITKAATPAAPSSSEGVDTDGCLGQLQTQNPDMDAENVAPGFVPATVEKPQYEAMTDCPENNVSMDMTEAQTGHILGQTCTEELPQESYPNSDHLKQTEATSQQSNEALGSSNPNGVENTNCPDSSDSNEIATRKEPKPRNYTSSISQKMEGSPSANDQDVDMLHSRKSRRMSLADLQSKVRRLSHMINTAPDTMAVESCTAPLAQLDHDLDKTSNDEIKSPPVQEPELEMDLVNSQDNTQAQCPEQAEEAPTTATPFNLKTKQLMSRLSVGGFKPKLPRRSKPDDPKKVNSVGEHTKTITINITNQMSNSDNDVSDIYDEELESYEDVSETLDARSPQKVTEKMSHSQEFNVDELLEEDVFEEDFISDVHGKKRPLPKDEINMENEKRMKASTEKATDVIEMELQSHFVDGNISTAPNMTTYTTDCSSSSHTTSIRCEAAFESTLKQSLFESQLEDYASDVQKRLDDGTITVLEFFKLFNIDFVIHNPRQSVLPGRLLSDTDHTPMDLLKDRHISRPKQMVYETNVLNLTEKVEGLKVRMRDLDQPLKIVNRPLWEEMRNSSEKELKSFGAKLKERNNIFRKMSKAQSHEMKEVLYANLVQANLEEQQKLRGTINEADEMIKSLDDCICELETELAAVEEKGFDDKPSLKSHQEEMKTVTEALDHNERQMSELGLQKSHNLNKLKRLKAETRNLESHVTMLHVVNEWKLGEKKDNCTVYTFLHDTMHLKLVYEKYNGTDADNQSERKISHITFNLQLDDEKSQCHARLVHKLLSQYIESETSWVEKYPTSRHVPKLLHDVGLVVSRCRLLGEELRLLKMWGGLRLDILDISCVDTLVHIVFSSLKKCSKFEVVFSVSLINHLCVLQVESFKNMIGSSGIKQIEDIVASFSPTRNLLTKIVKKIHDNLLL